MTNAYWFRPKRIGYGATPSTWEGWTITAAYCLVLSACVSIMVTHRGSGSTLVALFAVLIAATIALVVVCKKKTDGPWGWNAGARQISGKKD
ncbi:MAG TPA: hypothetical protein VKR55_16355 [Bradyrhizobium sp.]|uniref:hypothetical protein n=1 Tax=Bradyrhizobium sp. TaxID=376 RepID=UPI002BBEF071|nr:hypothetical protein [Bradyrhizobium sp.]HLZ03706.1 hypothetical protein [Bradyrhizobium sp.]